MINIKKLLVYLTAFIIIRIKLTTMMPLKNKQMSFVPYISSFPIHDRIRFWPPGSGSVLICTDPGSFHQQAKKSYFSCFVTSYDLLSLKTVVNNIYQCCWSMTFWCGSGSGCGSESFCFHHWPSKCQEKINKKKIQHITFWGFFLLFLLNDRRIRIRSRIHTSD